MVEFDRMSESAKEKVRVWVTTGDDWWWEYSVNNWKERLAEIGFNNPEIHFSLSGCQGDGVSFTCSSIDNEKMLTALMYCRGSFEDVSKYMIILELPESEGLADMLGIPEDEDLEFEFSTYRRDFHYAHKRTVTIDVDRAPDLFDDLSYDFAKWIEEYRMSLCDQIERDLEVDLEYIHSDEAIKEVIEANDWKFDEDGTFIC